MPKIILHGSQYGGGLGDCLVDLKVLYALKALYPHFELIYYYHGTARALFERIKFIDKIINLNEISLEKIREMNPEIFISTHRKGSFFRYLKQLNFKKAVVQPHFKSVFSCKLITPTPFFRRQMHISDINLKLVRAVDKRHFDANIAAVDFSKIKDFLPMENSLFNELLSEVKGEFKGIIGINPFSSYSQGEVGANFYTQDWLNLALTLANAYPKFLFIVLNFGRNFIQLNLPKVPNLRAFVNGDDLASLVFLQSKLDFFITPVTANSHLSEILQVPSLILVRKDGVTHRMTGGGELHSPLRDKGWLAEKLQIARAKIHSKC